MPENFESQHLAEESEDEKEIDDGLGVLINKKTLYHGSGTSGIKEQGKFNTAEEDTIGSGVYFTSKEEDAIRYAKLRAERENNNEKRNENAEAIIYESLIENMRLCDLRKKENVKEVLKSFKKILEEELKKPDLQWVWQTVLQEIIEIINNGKVEDGNIKEVAQRTGHMFSSHIRSLGYDGLIAFEGGEGEGFAHDTYLIFDSDRIKITKEYKVI